MSRRLYEEYNSMIYYHTIMSHSALYDVTIILITFI